MGVHRSEEPGVLRHAVHHRAGRTQHREHHAGDTVTGTAGAAQEMFDKLSAAGVDLPDVFRVLEDEGVEKFEKSWLELLEATEGQLDAAKK